jgi:hypothetical protein
MQPIDRNIQRALFRALRDRPLNLMDEEDRKLYEPLHDDRHDPVKRLFDTIDFSEIESVQLVAGFRGTGKTTELSRLEKDLWEAGFHVIRVDLDDFIDMHSPVDIREFLLILAGALSEQLTSERLLGKEKGLEKSFVERMRSLLPKMPSEITANAGVANVKLALRGDPGFRGQIREQLSGRLAELTKQIRAYHGEILEALRERAGREVKLVVILDSLEHLRGTGETSETVRRSVEELFFTHAARISLPDTHMVMSVPAFLFLEGNNLAAQFMNGAVQAWPAYQVQRRGGERTEVVDRIIRLVERRGDWRKILPDQAALERLIVASGGHLRDLLNMLVEAVHLSGHGVNEGSAEKIIGVAQRAYLPLYKDEIEVLGRVAANKNLKDVRAEEQERVLRFLDSGLLLCYLNDDFWYDVHPLVRDIVRSA